MKCFQKLNAFQNEFIGLFKVEYSRNRLQTIYNLDINQMLAWPIVIYSISSSTNHVGHDRICVDHITKIMNYI